MQRKCWFIWFYRCWVRKSWYVTKRIRIIIITIKKKIRRRITIIIKIRRIIRINRIIKQRKIGRSVKNNILISQSKTFNKCFNVFIFSFSNCRHYLGTCLWRNILTKIKIIKYSNVCYSINYYFIIVNSYYNLID